MFFDLILLSPQHKMHLSLPWLAATLGIKKLKKNEIVECNVVKVCDHIHSFLITDSVNPNKRFSLRLSVLLLDGLCLILRQQVILLQTEIDQTVLVRKNAAERERKALMAYSEIDGDDDSPNPIPKIKRTRKTKRDQQNTPDSLVERIGPVIGAGRQVEPEFNLDPLVLPDLNYADSTVTARVCDITLREETPRPVELELYDDFGEHDLEVYENEQNMNRESTQHAIADERRAIPVEELLRPVQKAPRVRVEEMQELVEPGAGPLPEQPPGIQGVPEIVVIEPLKEQGNETAQRISPSDDLTHFVVVQPVVAPKRPARKGKNIAASLLLKMKRKRFVPINQPMQLYEEEPLFTIISNAIPIFKPIKKFWPEWEQEAAHAVGGTARPRETGSTRISSADGSLGTDQQTKTPEASLASAPFHQIVTPTGSKYASTPGEKQREGDDTAEEVLAPATNGNMGPPNSELLGKRKRVVSVEEVQALEQGREDVRPEDQLEIPQEHPEVQPVDQIPLEEADASRTEEDAILAKWSRAIMEVVYRNDEKIGPFELCTAVGERITKQNMTDLFVTLLSLAGGWYVRLGTSEGSSELKSIERGSEEYPF